MLKTAEGILLQRNREMEELYQNMAEMPGRKKYIVEQRIIGSIDLPERSFTIRLSKLSYQN
jgi:hypothetical protein